MKTTYSPEPVLELPYAYGTLRVSGDEGAVSRLYEQSRKTQRQAALQAPQQAFKGVAGYLGSVAGAIKLEVRIAAFDTIHGTRYRKARHELLEQIRRRRFEASIGLSRVVK